MRQVKTKTQNTTRHRKKDINQNQKPDTRTNRNKSLDKCQFKVEWFSQKKLCKSQNDALIDSRGRTISVAVK